jgi:peptide/nickel transport system substrate-binding protein
MKRILPLLVATVAVAGTAFAQETPRKGGTLVIGLNADIRSLEPGINRDANTDSVVHHIYEGLVGYQTDFNVGPALAERWEVAGDGTTYRFTLRDGVRFHNGAPLTSAEVKAAWDRQMTNSAWTCRRFFNGSGGPKVEGVDAPDPRTVVFRLEKPTALFLKQLANFQCAVVVAHPDSWDANGKFKQPIGTGPLKLKEWKRGEQIVLERFADYRPSPAPASGYAGAREVHVDQVQFRVIPDASAAEAALVTGAVDILPDLEVQKIDAMKQRGMTVLTAPGLGWGTLLIQTKDSLLSNVKVRQAIAHAIDLDEIAESRFAGLGKGNPSAVASSMPQFVETFLAWPKHDPKRAAALLKEAGYAGQPIKMQTNKRYTGMYENAVLIQAMLASAGINVELEVLDWATQLDNYLNGKFQLQSFSYSARLDPGLNYAAFVADKSKNGWAQWEDPKALELLAASSATGDEQRRKEIFKQMHALMAEQIPIVPLYFDVTIEAVHPRVKGYKSWAANKPLSWGVWKSG